MTSAPAIRRTLATGEWRALAEAHRTRALGHTRAARARADRGQPHAVEDFLFTYYPFPFSKLEAWHPGPGVALEADEAAASEFPSRYYSTAEGLLVLDPAKMMEKERRRLGWIRELLVATRDRAPNFACHALHEWAMVYQGTCVRHAATTGLRLPQAQIDAVVESLPICCSHFDAFRFFAERARPFNRLQPTLETRAENEQPACIHANMDLYKWASKCYPWIASELLLDCFELAVELRSLDMRASPYDVGVWGYAPVKIETAEGRRQFEREQRDLAATAARIRQRLIDAIGAVCLDSEMRTTECTECTDYE